MTTIITGCLSEDTPKAALLNNACNLAVDALRAAHADLTSRWSEFLQLDGAFGKRRHRKSNAEKVGAEEKKIKAKKKGRLNVQENAITSELEKPIRSHLCSKQLRDASTILQLSCHIEAHVPSKTRTGDSLKNADIRFEMVGSDNPELDLVFEAKVIRDIADINSAYLGADGLERFCREEDPYTTGPVGGLLAYVDKASHLNHRDSLRKFIGEHPSRLDSKEAVLGLSNAAKEFCSSHKCENAHRAPIWMIHLIMDFPSMHAED
ncbi:hypothetical protein [Rhodocyclus tenuis]|uniref:hypothetical protein n=1 Tax=Rhodocyclus tenuis TaxID=1066 RepID=UPI0019035A95|nr:hypothetical protein [Rhodocyclus tenuis]